MAPAGALVVSFTERIQASAKQVWLTKFPFTQATETIRGNI